jgi:competence protein ComGC
MLKLLINNMEVQMEGRKKAFTLVEIIIMLVIIAPS